jgi:hypothetical protein
MDHVNQLNLVMDLHAIDSGKSITLMTLKLKRPIASIKARAQDIGVGISARKSGVGPKPEDFASRRPTRAVTLDRRLRRRPFLFLTGT